MLFMCFIYFLGLTLFILSSTCFLKIFKDTLHIMLSYAKFSANIITSLVKKKKNSCLSNLPVLSFGIYHRFIKKKMEMENRFFAKLSIICRHNCGSSLKLGFFFNARSALSAKQTNKPLKLCWYEVVCKPEIV